MAAWFPLSAHLIKREVVSLLKYDYKLDRSTESSLFGCRYSLLANSLTDFKLYTDKQLNRNRVNRGISQTYSTLLIVSIVFPDPAFVN